MKLSRKSKISVIAIVLILVLSAGMVLSVYFIENQKAPTWEYYQDKTAITYYDTGNEYGFQCATAFSSAMKNYLKGNVTSYISYNINIDTFCSRLIQAMSDARIPAVRLEVISKVITTNDFITLMDKLLKSMDSYDTFEDWSYAVTKQVADESVFSTVSSFFSSFFEITTLTVDEVSKIVYCYLARYGSEPYKAYLALFGEEKFLSLLSDTLYVMNTLNGVKNTTALTFTTEALRSSLYQLGSIYLSIANVQGSYDTFERVLGFPDTFPSDIASDYEEDINQMYGNIKGTFGKLLLLLGTFFTNLTSEQIASYYSYYYKKTKTSDEIVELEIKLGSAQATEDDINRLNELLYDNIVNHTVTVQALVPAITSSLEEFNEKYMHEENGESVITKYSEIMQLMRILVFYLGEFTDVSSLNENITNIQENTKDFQDGLRYFENHSYTLEEIQAMDVTSEEYIELIRQTNNVGTSVDLMTAYCTSAFSIWYSYKTIVWSKEQ